MNKETVELIEKLATKLGTTAEHLWDVLVKQAPISAWTNLVEIFFLVALLIWAFRFVRAKTAIPPGKDERGYSLAADWCDEGACLAWLLLAVCGTALLITCSCGFEAAVAGFANPEYWALKQILK